MYYLPLIILSLRLLTGCSDYANHGSSLTAWQVISGRETPDEPRQAIYRVRMPSEWIRVPDEEFTADTTKPLSTFVIKSQEGDIRITIHNFPSENLEERIPPTAQITRWKNQFEILDQILSSTEAEAWGGFTGNRFEGIGLLKGERIAVLGWAMQLDPHHYRTLSALRHKDQKNQWRQMSADFTIKAIGTVVAMQTHENALKAFAASFELIEEIPSR